MNKFNPNEKLQELLKVKHENEIVEFKTGSSHFDVEKLGQYFSALSNEANLKDVDSAWLVLGVDDQGNIVGTKFRSELKSLHNLKQEISSRTNGGIGFTEIHEVISEKKRVILFQIPAALAGNPTSFGGHYYGREGESLVALSTEKIRRIHNQTAVDWSAQVVQEASLNDLDSNAIQKAREEYKKKHPHKREDVDRWSDIVFLNKAKITIHGKITNTALLLLGNDNVAHLFASAVAQISWVLYESEGNKPDYHHFYPPFIINNNLVLNKIRNLTYRYMTDNTLFPTEITQYDPKVIREALHNCIAHQDYRLNSRILVLEHPDYLIFENAGSFLPNTVESVIEENSPQIFYRNKFLCEAMLNLNMIETIGDGIRTMFTIQKKRYFPLPDYDFSKRNVVKVKIYGSILDKNYTQTLLKMNTLELSTVMLLDKVQKRVKIDDAAAKFLKSLHLIEGRKPSYYISSKIADFTKGKASYIKSRGLDDHYYRELILDLIKRFKTVRRSDIDDLLISKMPEILTDIQKKNKITNLIYSLSKEKKIINIGNSKKLAVWTLAK